MEVEFAALPMQKVSSHPITVSETFADIFTGLLHKYLQRDQESAGRICPGFQYVCRARIIVQFWLSNLRTF